LSALIRFDEILSLGKKHESINLGTSRGTTVRELLDAFNSVVDSPIPFVEVARRPGDIAGSYANDDRAVELLQWKPELSIVDAIRDSLKWSELRREILGK
jgi:UDP-glucose 4-epimerase